MTHLLRLRILFAGIIMGPVLLGAVAFLLHGTGSFTPKTDDTLAAVLGILVPITAIGGYGAGKIVFERMLAAARVLPTLEAKLQAYQTATIVRLLLMETPAIFSMAVYLVFAGHVYAILGTAMVGFMLLFFPSPDGVVMDLHLEGDEKRQVRGHQP